jgi:hypothetical protein
MHPKQRAQGERGNHKTYLELCFSRNPLVRLPLHLKFGIMSAHPILALMVRLASAEGAWSCASADLLGQVGFRVRCSGLC